MAVSLWAQTEVPSRDFRVGSQIQGSHWGEDSQSCGPHQRFLGDCRSLGMDFHSAGLTKSSWMTVGYWVQISGPQGLQLA